VTNTVKNVTMILWLWKSGTKASEPQFCWQTIAAQWKWMYLTPNTGESDKPLHFRGQFLPVSCARKFCFAHLNCYVSLKFCLIKKSVYISEFRIKRTAKFTYWSPRVKKS
jgi:hypothetical protein